MVNKKRQKAHSASDEATLSMNIRRTAVSLAVAAALPGAMVLPTAAMAQDDGEVIEEVVTTGYRQSLANSIATKRDSSSIVEAISAEDIGKLPDASIGESLARLPGLAAQRFDGRANKISIRGLAPDFTTTTLNGRELVSSDNNLPAPPSIRHLTRRSPHRRSVEPSICRRFVR
jgi:iron complex outermembrane receptor protein